MTEKVETEQKEKKEKQNTKPKSAWSTEEKKQISTYGCQLLVENATKEQVQEKKVPSDAMIVTYRSEERFIRIFVVDRRLIYLIYTLTSLVKVLLYQLIGVMELLILHSGDTNHLRKRGGENHETE